VAWVPLFLSIAARRVEHVGFYQLGRYAPPRPCGPRSLGLRFYVMMVGMGCQHLKPQSTSPTSVAPAIASLRCTCVMHSFVAIPAVPSALLLWRGPWPPPHALVAVASNTGLRPRPPHTLIGLRYCLLFYIQVPPITDASHLGVVRLTHVGRVYHSSLM